MTPTEIAQEAYRNRKILTEYDEDINTWISSLSHRIEEILKAKCKEQRELCWKNTYKHLDLHLNKSHGVMEDSENMIRNAPEPNFD